MEQMIGELDFSEYHEVVSITKYGTVMLSYGDEPRVINPRTVEERYTIRIKKDDTDRLTGSELRTTVAPACKQQARDWSPGK